MPHCLSACTCLLACTHACLLIACLLAMLACLCLHACFMPGACLPACLPMIACLLACHACHAWLPACLAYACIVLGRACWARPSARVCTRRSMRLAQSRVAQDRKLRLQPDNHRCRAQPPGARHVRRDATRQYDTTRHDATRQHDAARHDTTRHDTTRHDATRHDTTRPMHGLALPTIVEPRDHLRHLVGILVAVFE